jgi:hypothetical protein
MPVKFLRTLRLDASDPHVFERAAEPGEWAIPGTFLFSNDTPETLTGKRRQAFVQGWLGLDSFGHSTLVAIAEIGDGALNELINRLADHLVEHYGAPDRAIARPMAEAEIRYAAELAEPGGDGLLAVMREFGEDGILERFRILQPSRPDDHAKLWTIEPD